ncbi:HSF-type DNA-binding-domain-containing protein [Tirmania nivea]|nr:HSF-type DNA-binding-domain-containing protein [Tirmania nivea]
MLEDPTYRHIVRWNDMGDSFIVLDNTEFTKNVLPRHFKHSNFASFVRQLNKYDFHKIRNTDETGGSQYGEQAWEFKHPNFLMHSRDQLENIRRKAPAARKSAQKAASEDPSALQTAFAQIEELQGHLQQLRDVQKGIDHQLERNDTMCQALVAQVGNMHKKLMDYEDLIQRLVVQLAQKEDDEDEYDDMEEDMDEDMDENEGEDGYEEQLTTSTSVPFQGLTPFIMEHSTPLGQNYDQVESAETSDGRRRKLREGNDGDSVQASKPRLATSVPPQVSVNSEKDKDGITTNGHTGIYLPPITEVGSLPSGPSLHTLSQIKQSLHAANLDKGKGKETTGTPLERRPPPSRHYTAPILVVDDDPMCRRLLMLFFSYNKQEVDCASDGISAVEKVNYHKYSIIFMDVILPLLDGVSATKLMRKTDKETPIVCLASTTNGVDLDRYKRSGRHTEFGLLNP